MNCKLTSKHISSVKRVPTRQLAENASNSERCLYVRYYGTLAHSWCLPSLASSATLLQCYLPFLRETKRITHFYLVLPSHCRYGVLECASLLHRISGNGNIYLKELGYRLVILAQCVEGTTATCSSRSGSTITFAVHHYAERDKRA